MELTPLSPKQGQWQLQLDGDIAAFQSVTQNEIFQIPRGQSAEQIELLDLFGNQAMLVVRQDKKKLQFKLSPEQQREIDAWLGPPTEAHLRVTLRKRYAYILPIAILYVIVSLPLPGNPEQGLQGIPFNPVTLLLGIGLFGLWIHARLRPKPYLFLLDAIWFFLLAGTMVYDIIRQKTSYFWIVWIVLLGMLIHSGIKQYRRFIHLSR